MKLDKYISKINSWLELKDLLEESTKLEKGKVFEEITKHYLEYNPVYRSKLKTVWLQNEIPTLVLEKLNLPSNDQGIDLIAETFEGTYWAIQCKYLQNESQSLTHRSISTFISLSTGIAENISHCLVCTTVDDYAKIYKGRKNIGFINADEWRKLDKQFFDWLRVKLKGKEQKLKAYTKRPHQEKALGAAREYFLTEKNTRGKLIFPCGAGKSLTGFWMTEELSSKSTIIAVPSLSLVKQTLEVYLREIVAQDRIVKWLCVCSDESIGKDDDIILNTGNLGVPCQTDPEYISLWLKENREEEIIVFTTYQSGRIIGEVAKKLNFSFDLGILDEAHKTVGFESKLFSHLLFDENINIRKRVFMTATERFYRGQKDDIISMDDHEIYGEIFAQMSFKEAIDLGLLTDYKIITIDVTKREIGQFIQQNNLVQLNGKWGKETEARSLASMLALRKAMDSYPIKNAVSFHSSIDKAVRNKELQNHITETYNYDPIDAYTVSGKLPISKRNVIIQEFANSPRSLITNSRCLTEGVDVPNIDCIVFSDPRKSKVDIVQALGRSLRKKEGKDWGYVILPVIYNEETHEIDNENFEEILAIIRGLASNDERIIEYFKDKAGPSQNSKPYEKQFKLDVFSDFLDESELSNQLQIRLWEKLSRFNWLEFEDARKIVQNLKLKNVREWEKIRSSLPANIPSNPYYVYKDSGWGTWGDWLGNGMVSDWNRKWLSYDEAEKFVHELNFKSEKEWREYSKSGLKPSNIPSTPANAYKFSGWDSMGKWLGTNYISGVKRKYLSFLEAKIFVSRLGLKSETDWRVFCKTGKRPENIPYKPDRYYISEWHSWGDWIGTNSVANYKLKFVTYEEAKKLIHQFKISSFQDWKALIKQKEFSALNIPKNPIRSYVKEWQGWDDFFGPLYTPKQNNWPSYEEFKILVNDLNIKSQADYKRVAKSNIPSHPDRVYKLEWEGWPVVFGKKT